MKLDVTLKVLHDILDKLNVYNVTVRDALNPVYIEYDEETLEPVEDKEFPKEFDLVILADLSHGEIQILDSDILVNYDNIEMRVRDGHMEIFETFPEEKEATA